MEDRVPSLLQRLQGREFPSFWKDGTFENILDKRGNVNYILRDTAKSIKIVYDEIGCARDPRVIKRIATVLEVGHNYIHKIVEEYVSLEKCHSPELNNYYDPFDVAMKHHSCLQKNIRVLNDSIYDTNNDKKLDKLCFRVQRACQYFHRFTIYFETTERNVNGY